MNKEEKRPAIPTKRFAGQMNNYLMNKYPTPIKKSNQSKSGQFFLKFPTCLIPHLKDSASLLMYLLFRVSLNKDWKFYQQDISDQLNQSKRQTIKQLEVLKKLGLVSLCGNVGQQHYRFDVETYNRYLSTPFQVQTSEGTSPKMGPPSPQNEGGTPSNLMGGPPSKRATIVDKKREEIKEERKVEGLTPSFLNFDGSNQTTSKPSKVETMQEFDRLFTKNEGG